MSQQTPVHVKLTVPAKHGGANRPGLVQVIQTRPPGGGATVLQQKFPNTSPITVRSLPSSVIPSNTNTAVQYKREADEISGFNQQQFFQGSQNYGGSPLISLNANSMQNLAGLPLSSQGGNLLASQGLSSIATSRKPCNCTKSNCLKLYCECFAQGQLCQNCNCTNCMNNLAHEEERRRAVKMTLERNPTAFNPKIGRGEGERRHTKGCNCKRSGCLKNYCECYEAKISCSDMCRCQGCKNTEDSIERRSLLRLAALGSYKSKHSGSFKKHLTEPPPETLPHSFFTWEVIEAVVSCLLAQVDDAERRDLPPAAQERLVLEEFGRSIQRVITSAGKAQVRTTSPNVLHGTGSDGEMGDDRGIHGSIDHDSGNNMRESPNFLNRDPVEEDDDDPTEDDLDGDIEDHKGEVLRQIRSRHVNQAYDSHRGSSRHEIDDEVDLSEMMLPQQGNTRSSSSRQRRPAPNVTDVRTSSRRHVPSRRFLDEEYL